MYVRFFLVGIVSMLLHAGTLQVYASGLQEVDSQAVPGNEIKDNQKATGTSRAEKNQTPFEELFSHVRSMTVEGTEKHPVFQVTSLAVRNDRIAITDQPSATLTVFDTGGTLLFQIDDKGRGPGDLLNPRGVQFDNEGRIAVLDVPGNDRIQFFAADDGEPVGILTENIRRPGPYAFFEGKGDEQRIVFTTRASCPGYDFTLSEATAGADKKLCVIQTHDVSSEEMINRFATINEVEPGAYNLPYTLGHDGKGRYYVGKHVGGGHIAIFNSDGERLARFALDKAPNIKPLDYSNLPDLGDGFMTSLMEVFRETEFTRLSSIYPIGGDVVIQIEKHGGEDDGAKSLAVFDQDGTYLTSTPTIDVEAHDRQDDRIFFVETDPDSEFGSYIVHEYRYKGVDK